MFLHLISKDNIALFILIAVTFLVYSCNNISRDSENKIEEKPLFTELNSTQTGIYFVNVLKENKNFNIVFYEYLYNGGGVAVGDINNDGLPDLFFTSTMKNNALYVNQGGLRFTDISQTAGIDKHTGLCTGVEMVDINNDGWLDIFICQTGFVPVSFKSTGKTAMFL